MKLSIDQEGQSPVAVRVAGDITQRHVSPFVEPLGDALGEDGYEKPVMLNLQQVDMLDSSGVGWLLVCHKRFHEKGGKLVLHSFSPTVSNVLKVLNMQKVLNLAETENDARRMFEGDAS